ncbi:MAG: four helix bundle suffix domain-containing protein [Thermoanaerobaculia bacterium]|nr:four helix bundle suffix domain-containing protein [Thermoanaerobaculia bacterium]
MTEPLIPKHGGYRRLISFQVAQLAFDVTVRFCDRYIDRKSRTRDQMVQAARSGVQNIAEGSQASGTSKKMELKLTNVARASLEEPKLDYEDFLRQRGLPQWEPQDPRRAELIRRRPKNLEEVAQWIRDVRTSTSSISSTASTTTSQEAAANGALALLAVATALLDRQVASLARAFETDGGFTERLYRIRVVRRTGSTDPHSRTPLPPTG